MSDRLTADLVGSGHGDGGLSSLEDDRLIRAFESLSPQETSVMLANRVIIEQAKGMLMMIYAIDAERAFELLKWRSQTGNVKLRSLARQLIEEFPLLTDDERLPTRAGYDQIFLTAVQRIPLDPK